MARDDQITPHPPATPEFAPVQVGGPAHEYPTRPGVTVRKFVVGGYDNNVFVIASEGQAVVVDGAAEPDRILAEVTDLAVVAVVQTHGHVDHVQALPRLVRSIEAPVLAHPADPWPVPTEALADDDMVEVGAVTLRVLLTPGHTPGGVCYLLEAPGGPPHLFTGDTLFPGGPGNTRGNADDFSTIMRSLDRLFDLPDDTRVSPGHGLDTTLGRERPYVTVWRARGW
jgi:glyoxylase-like metal-dependent hydrolase (beta-lactamase superfamily II)